MSDTPLESRKFDRTKSRIDLIDLDFIYTLQHCYNLNTYKNISNSTCPELEIKTRNKNLINISLAELIQWFRIYDSSLTNDLIHIKPLIITAFYLYLIHYEKTLSKVICYNIDRTFTIDCNESSSIKNLDFVLFWDLGNILKLGAIKYGEYNWKLLENPINRYYNAAMRHMILYRSKEEIDEESNISHILHALSNIMFLYYFAKKGKKKNESSNI